MHKLNQNMIGWFAACLSKEIDPGQKKTILIGGNNYILTRDHHDKLLCNNKNTEVIEQNDIIYVWRHPHGIQSSWHPPVLDATGWSQFLFRELIVRTHPQEVYENSIDLSHFSVVHHFQKIKVLQEPCFDHYTMSVKHKIHRMNTSFLFSKPVEADFEVCLYGIGIAYNHINVPSYGMRVRMFALTTPINHDLVCIRIAVSIAFDRKNYFKQLLLPLMHRAIFKNIVNDFCQDIVIWENKCYHHFPLLVKGDGQIIKFRQWCRQFYF